MKGRKQKLPVCFCVELLRRGTLASHFSQRETSLHQKQYSTVFALLSTQKCEKMKDTHITIHSFMQENLGLNGVALKVYALIYSFTRAGSDCHGSVDYICERVGASRTSVKAAIKKLLEKGYITKIEDSKIKTNRYVANDDPFEPTGQKSTGQYLTPPGQKLTPDRSEIDPNNKEDNKGDNNNINELNIHSLIKEYWKDKPRPIQAFGSKKVVMMTLHQYANLLRAVGVNPTLSYVRLLENRITKGMFPVKDDHYQQIIDWAREDGFVTPEGEEILKN